jgi:hypothetical protein
MLGICPSPPPPAPFARWATPVLLALSALFLIGLFSTEFADTDAWWHLATGRFIATQHRLPDPDPFAFTTSTAPPAYPGEGSVRHFNLTHEWLAQLVWYGIQLGGRVRGPGAVEGAAVGRDMRFGRLGCRTPPGLAAMGCSRSLGCCLAGH